MNTLNVKRLDHHGIVSGAFDALGFEDKLNEIIGIDPQEDVAPGQVVKSMVLVGLGFCNRPLMLTPQFFSNLPVEELIGKGVTADKLNRHKLGRILDAIHEKGCEGVFSILADMACRAEGVDRQKQSLDTTSFSLTGEYDAETETEAIRVCHGHSKDHRPDLKQMLMELIVSQDGGIPLLMRCHDGNASDSKVFEERSRKVLESIRNADELTSWVGDSKLYSASNAPSLAKLPFITRIPRTVKLENKFVQQALSAPESWILVAGESGYRYQRFDVTHHDIPQRWLVISSEAARARATKTVMKAVQKEKDSLTKALFHFQAQRFSCSADGDKAFNKLTKGIKYHSLNEPRWDTYKKFSSKGRPRADEVPKEIMYQGIATAEVDEDKISNVTDTKACFVLGTRIPLESMSDVEIFQTYKSQSKVECGFRFLKDPLFFTSSLFLKKPERLEALLMVMTLSLLVYSIAQRRLRKNLAEQNETLPNQLGKADRTPTLRWIFQTFEGISVVTVDAERYLAGMTKLREKTIRMLNWPTVFALYQINTEGG